MLKLPIWITNFKHYETSTGQKGLELAQIHERVAVETGASIGITPGITDLQTIAKSVSIPVIAQHVDGIDYGKHTGRILPQSVKKAGAVGSLLNHSERRIDPEILQEIICCAQKAGLCRILCAESPEEVELFAGYDVDFIAFEPPELIGSTTQSVATAHPESIAQAAAAAGDIPLLVGAGINSPEDVKVSLELGAQGFLVATAITKANDPEAALRSFVEVMKITAGRRLQAFHSVQY